MFDGQELIRRAARPRRTIHPPWIPKEEPPTFPAPAGMWLPEPTTFNGSTKQSIGQFISDPQQGALSAWIKIPSSNPTTGTIISRRPTPQTQVSLNAIGGNYDFLCVTENNHSRVQIPIPNTDYNTWVMLTATIQNNVATLFRNGMQVAQNTSNYNAFWGVGTGFWIGASYTANGGTSAYYFVGDMHHVGIWNIALTADDVMNLYNATKI